MFGLTLGAQAMLVNLVQWPGVSYLAKFDTWTVFAVVMNLCLLTWWRFNPLPQPGTTTMKDVQNAYSTSEREGIPDAKDGVVRDAMATAEFDCEVGKDAQVATDRKPKWPTCGCCSC